MYATEQTYVMAIRTWINSRVGRGSLELWSHLTDMFIAAKKNWDAAISNSPRLSSKTGDRADFHHSEMARRGVCLGRSRGDVSSVILGARSPPARNSESGDNFVHGVIEG